MATNAWIMQEKTKICFEENIIPLELLNYVGGLYGFGDVVCEIVSP